MKSNSELDREVFEKFTEEDRQEELMKDELYYEPIKTHDEAETLFSILIERGKIYHPRDDAKTVGNLHNGKFVRIFPNEDAEALNDRMNEVYALEWPYGKMECPCAMIVDLEEQD